MNFPQLRGEIPGDKYLRYYGFPRILLCIYIYYIYIDIDIDIRMSRDHHTLPPVAWGFQQQQSYMGSVCTAVSA